MKNNQENRDNVGDLLASAIPTVPATRKEPKKGNPPVNPIIGQKRADKWDKQIGGIVMDIDVLTARQAANAVKLDSMMRWVLIRDLIVILILLVIGVIVGFNTTQLWGWG